MTLIICEPGHVPTGLNADGTAKPCAAEGTPEADAYWQLVEEAKANVLPVQPEIEVPAPLTSSVKQPVEVVELANTGAAPEVTLLAAITVALLVAAAAVHIARFFTKRSKEEPS